MAASWKRSKTGSTMMNEQSFTQLVEEYQVPIFNLCYRILGNWHEAEDAAQEAFVRAFMNYQQYDPARSMKTWLFSIAHHYCIDLIRKRYRMAFISLDDFSDRYHSPLQPPSPEEAMSQREDSLYLRNLLLNIPPEYRNAIVLRYWFDLTYEEIAEISGCSISAAKSRVFRAKKQLSALHDGRTFQSPIRQEAVFNL